jgi:hypothetical protein
MSDDHNNNKHVQLARAKNTLRFWIHQKNNSAQQDKWIAEVSKLARAAGKSPQAEVDSVTSVKPSERIMHLAIADVQSFIGNDIGEEYEDIGNFIHRIHLNKAKKFYKYWNNPKRDGNKRQEKQKAFWRKKIKKWAGKDEKRELSEEEVDEIINSISSEISSLISNGINDYETHEHVSDLMMMRHLIVETHMPELEFHAIEGNYGNLQSAREREFHAVANTPSEVVDLLLDIDNDETIAQSIKRVTSHYRCCEVCGKSAHNKCKACKAVFYCCGECQKEDWNAHKAECAAIANGMTWGELDLESQDPNSIHVRHLTRHSHVDDVSDVSDQIPELEEIGAGLTGNSELEYIGPRHGGRGRGRGGHRGHFSRGRGGRFRGGRRFRRGGPRRGFRYHRFPWWWFLYPQWRDEYYYGYY